MNSKIEIRKSNADSVPSATKLPKIKAYDCIFIKGTGCMSIRLNGNDHIIRK